MKDSFFLITRKKKISGYSQNYFQRMEVGCSILTSCLSFFLLFFWGEGRVGWLIGLVWFVFFWKPDFSELLKTQAVETKSF